MNGLRLDGKPVCPPISDELIAWLQWVYPDKLPEHTEFDSRDVAGAVGRQEVIKRLRVERMKQERPAAPTTNE